LESPTDGVVRRTQTLETLAKEIDTKLPPQLFDLADASKRYSMREEDCMNTVLLQELGRYNRLVDTIRQSLQSLQRAQRGLVLMTADLERVADSLLDNRVPDMWSRVAYPSLKPLSMWVIDLTRRLHMFTDWLRNGQPVVFHLPYFMHTHSFLTAVLQTHARWSHVMIDEITFDVEVMPQIPPDHQVGDDDGCYIHGLYLEGATWDSEKKALAPIPLGPNPQLHYKMPVMFLKPVHTSSATVLNNRNSYYRCPVYKTSRRSGLLTSTGANIDFVLALNLRTVHSERYWIKRGVALLCQLDV